VVFWDDLKKPAISVFHPEDGGTRFLQNVDNYIASLHGSCTIAVS
jgi:hypothetical protein